jgi:ferredoxin-NADP reductase
MTALASRLLAALAYPRSIDDFIELAFPLATTRELRARIVAVQPETHDTATLVLRPSARLRPHRAGQHVALTASIGGVRRTRCFSISSAEGRAGDPIALTVKARPGGAVTPRLVSGELRGQAVVLSQPAGTFVLPQNVPDRVLFVSGGSGVTPVMSMLRTLLARGHRGEITFLHWARSPADVIFGAELARVALEAPPSVRVHVRTGLFEAGHLAESVPDFARWETWACGPPPMLDAVLGAFAAHDAAARVHVERFSLPGSWRDAASSDAAWSDAATETASEGEVSFVRSGRKATGKGPILTLAEGAGLSPPSGCRMGICHSCVCRKISGVTRDVRTGELSSDAEVDIQACVTAPVGPVAIDL